MYKNRYVLIIFMVLFAGIAPAQSSDRSEFVHPGILHNQAELDFIKQKIQAEEEPWFSGWKTLLEADISDIGWQSKATANVLRGAYNKPDNGASHLERDAAAVYSQAIQWVVTGDARHAQKAIAILNNWSSTLKSIGEHDAKLLVGMTGVSMINGAEIIRHTSDFWEEDDIARFEKMLLDVHYEVIKDFFDWANGNWDASMIQTMLSIGVFVDSDDIFQRAVKYFLEGKGNGAILNYFNDFGQCQESGRDQLHVQMGIGFLGTACEIAWKQGVDLYGAYDNRLALGFEYTAKYNLGYDVPFESYSSINGRYKHTAISTRGRGRFRPIYERAYHHYHDRMGLEMPYTLEAIQKNRPEKWHIQHTSWGTLLHAELPVTQRPLVEVSRDKKIDIFFDESIPQHEFAATDLKTAMEGHGLVVKFKNLSELSEKHKGQKVVIALTSNKSVLDLLSLEKGAEMDAEHIGEQAFALRTTKSKGKSYWVIGGDVAGGMYGGLQIAENISFDGLKGDISDEQKPHIKKRGIKFNIPLDQRVPSFDSDGDQDKSTIKDMWDMSFWTEYLDDLARYRYNTLSYWTKHPFTAMIKLEEYPAVEVHDVIDGYGNFVKKMSIDEKITFWQEVMQHAKNRSIDIFYLTWNIYVNNAEGKYGITNEPTNELTKAYIRKCVEQFLKTYPHVSGIGVTAGEHMPNMTFGEREKWLWETYGLGIMDVKKEQPDRQIRFIHRHWYSSVSDIMSHFKDFDGTFDFSFKYAKAHMYSSPKIVFEDFLLDEMPDGIQSWWNLRNDDIFYTRWGDPEFAREFILNFDKEKTAGYLMGSDGYTWGRVYSSKNPEFQGKLEIKKHWYQFMLWGRLGYNPDLSTEIFKKHIRLHFPETSVDNLYQAWKTASKIIPQTTRFFWRDWDVWWYPEACKAQKLMTVKDFMVGNTMEGSGILNIADYGKKTINKEEITDITPFEVANNLEGYATQTLEGVSKIEAGTNVELQLTKNDIKAMAHLGNYYSEKIRGATNLYLFTTTDDSSYHKKSIQNLEQAVVYWKDYVKIMDAQYHERTYARTNKLDWDELTKAVEYDIEIAKTIEKFKIEIKVDNIKDGDEFPKNTDLEVKAEINSTFNLNVVVLLINGEIVGRIKKGPFVWTPDKYSQLKAINSGSYTLEFRATDEAGNRIEKHIQIKVK